MTTVRPETRVSGWWIRTIVVGAGSDRLFAVQGRSSGVASDGYYAVATPTRGRHVCKSGATTGVTCGTIDRKYATVNYAEGVAYNLDGAPICAQGGDAAAACSPAAAAATIGAVTIDATRSERRSALLGPVSVAALGAIVTLIMLFLPISVAQPGDHEARLACGNAFDIEVVVNVNSDSPESYWRQGYDRCTGARGDRLAKTVAALAVTVLLTAAAATWTRRGAPGR
jgi:hypothetical protein